MHTCHFGCLLCCRDNTRNPCGAAAHIWALVASHTAQTAGAYPQVWQDDGLADLLEGALGIKELAVHALGDCGQEADGIHGQVVLPRPLRDLQGVQAGQVVFNQVQHVLCSAVLMAVLLFVVSS